MTEVDAVRKQNEELARRINEEARANPHSPYAGKFVGLANGRVVATAANADEVIKQLRSVEPNPLKIFCWEAGLDYDEVQEIW